MKIRTATLTLLSAVLLLILAGCNLANSPQQSQRMTKEQIAELISDLEAEINNGGFDQFFYNSAGNHTADTIAALEAIGATHTANIVRRAAAKFPEGMPARDRDLRQEQLEAVSPNSDAFEAEDTAFLDYRDDLESMVKTYKSG